MKGRTVANITAATMMTVGLGLGAGTGYLISDIRHDDDMERLDKHQAELSDIEESQLALDFTGDEVVAQVGESCLRYLNHYSPDGDLADTSENVIVDDLLRLTQQPCGGESTEVRAVVRNYVGSTTTLSENTVRADQLNSFINDIEDDPNGMGSERAWAMGGIGLGGLAVSGLLASLAYVDIEYHYRHASRKQWK